jgi:hypothetical protein
VWADQIVEISDGNSDLAGAQDVQRARLMVDTRKWVLSKLIPKKYGDRQQIDHTGEVTLKELIIGSLKHDA